jgi:creatinine amidohydrolase/Fe(II)-dependent formamide hydrolase-like protein
MAKKPSLPEENQAPRRSVRDESAEALAPLGVIDTLEIGPVRLERRRLVAPYTVVRDGKSDTTNLVYSYDEDVFDPADPADHNLATMIAAQVALNYGLFCDRIVFPNNLDAADRRFLTEMAENTAREIYVKKFLEPNPFIRGAAASLPAVKRRSYLRAILEFPGTTGPHVIPWSPKESRDGRVAVSSSGGKDSLLSFGLLRELGYDVHPIFGNESGRHWFTALNAFRDFKERVPNTARVWMNTDRVFAWMLRHLQFVRPDFASVRSDEYPIRLWTVALFVFGALPLLRRRGVGRLVVGDEFDTTERRAHRGITHYNGLFDQSRYFDNALSRYYARKKWRLSQFSILRPLSEMLIETILVRRYPDLYRNQMSCHATHTEEGRVHPCGKCEKCRRIVGTVLAVGGDPTACGYTREQIDGCVAALPAKGVQQESAGAGQLMWMLQERGILKPNLSGRHRARENPEILKLRIDRERSPMDAVPAEMRAPLFKIFLEYADGAVRRAGKTWLEIDALNDPGLHRPYAHERSKPQSGEPAEGEARPTGYILAEMTWPEAQRRFKEVDVALLPVGATEQHGPHLPLDTDAFDADYLARAVAERCSDPKPIVLPLVPYGVSYHHEDFSGTFSIANDTLSRLAYDIGMSAARNGVTKLVMINGHGGNDPALNYAAQEINRDAHIFVAVDSGETSDVDIYAMIETPNDVHAGEIETSTSLAVRPELVHLDRLEKLVPEFSSRYLDFTSKRGISWHAFTKKISESGVMGDPTRASAEKGRKMWEVMIAHLVAFVEVLKQLTLDEIYQRRY